MCFCCSAISLWNLISVESAVTFLFTAVSLYTEMLEMVFGWQMRPAFAVCCKPTHSMEQGLLEKLIVAKLFLLLCDI